MAKKTYDLSDIDEGFEEKESTPTYDLSDIDEGFEDDSTVSEEEVNVSLDEPSTPVAGKKKEDTVSDSELPSETPSSDSSTPEINSDNFMEGIPSRDSFSETSVTPLSSSDISKVSEAVLPKKEDTAVPTPDFNSLEEELDFYKNQLGRKVKETEKLLNKDSLEEPVSDVEEPGKYDQEIVQMGSEESMIPSIDLEAEVFNIGGYEEDLNKVNKLEKDIQVRDQVIQNVSNTTPLQIERAKSKSIKNLDEEDPIRKEYEFNKKIKDLTQGEDALRMAKFSDKPIDVNMSKSIAEADTPEKKKELSDKLDSDIENLMRVNNVPSWYNSNLNTLEEKASAYKGLLSITKEADSVRNERDAFLSQNTFAQINEDIESIQDKLADGEISEEEAKKAIDAKQSLKASFFLKDPKEVAQNVAKSMGSSQTIYKDFIRKMNDDENFNKLSPKEKFDSFYLALSNYANYKADQAGWDGGLPDFITTGIRDFFNTKDIAGLPIPEGVLSITEEEKEAFEAMRSLRALEPIFYLNRASSNADRDNFFQSFWGTMGETLFPETSGAFSDSNLTRISKQQGILTSISDLGIEDKSINKDAISSLQEEANPESLMGEDFSMFNPSTYGSFDFDWEKAGSLGGTTGAIMLTIAASSVITKGAGNISKLNKQQKAVKAYRDMQASMLKTMRKSPRLTKYLSPAVKEGVKFEVAGDIFENQEEELNFLSGALGSLGGELTKGAINKLVGTDAAKGLVEKYNSFFGPKAKAAIEIAKSAGSRGVGEMQEETIQELTNTWQSTPDGKSFLEELRAKFPNMSSIEEFYISSFIMGSVMGMGGAVKDGIKKYKESVNGQTPALDQVMAETATDVEIAKEQAKKDIGKEALGVITQEDIDNIEEAKKKEGTAYGAPIETVEESETQDNNQTDEEITIQEDGKQEQTEGTTEKEPVTQEEVLAEGAETTEVESNTLTEEESNKLEALKEDLKAKEEELAEDFNNNESGEINPVISSEIKAIKDQIAELESKPSMATDSTEDVTELTGTERTAEDVASELQGVDAEIEALESITKGDPQTAEDLVLENWEALDPDDVRRELGLKVGSGKDISPTFTKKGGKSLRAFADSLIGLTTNADGNTNVTEDDLFQAVVNILSEGSMSKAREKYSSKSKLKELKKRKADLESELDSIMPKEIDEMTEADKAQVMDAIAEEESIIPQDIKDEIMAAEFTGEDLTTDEEASIDGEFNNVDGIDDIPSDKIDAFVDSAKETFGMTDEQAAQLKEILRSKNKEKNGKQDTEEKQAGVSGTETTTNDAKKTEQKTKQGVDSEVEGAERRNKSFLNRVLKDPKTPKSHVEMLSNIDKKYTQESNEWQSDQADILIDTFDKAGSLNDLWLEISNLNNDISFGVRAMIALKMKRLSDEKGHHSKSSEITKWIDSTARKFGQFNQALIDRGSPESVLRSKKKELEEKAKKKMSKDSNSGSGKTVGEDVNDAVDEMNEASKKAAKEVSDSFEIEESVEEVKKKMTKKEALEKAREAKKQKREAEINKLRDVRKKAKEDIKKSKAKYFNSSIGGFTAEGIELAAKIASTYIKEGVIRVDSLAEKLRSFFKGELDIDLTDSQIGDVLNYSYEGKTAVQFLTEERKKDAAKKLSARVLNATKDSKRKGDVLDSIDLILKELTQKGKQDIPKRKKGEDSNQYRNRVLDAISSVETARDIWDEAQLNVEASLENKVNDGKMTEAEKADVLGKLQGFFGDYVGRPFADSLLDKAVSEQLKSMNQKVRDIINKHWTDKAKIGEDLASKFVNGAGLSPEAATDLANEVIDSYNSKIEEAAEKALQRTLGSSRLKLPKAKRTEVQKLIKAYNLGALDSDMYKTLFAEEFGLAAISNQDEKVIAKFIHDLNLYPEGSEALHRGMSEFKTYLKGIRKDTYKLKFITEFLTEVFYTNVLSGFSTLARGAKGVAMTAGAEIMIEAIKNPKLAFLSMQGVNALWRGAKRGGVEFASIMRDGYVPMSKSLENTTGSLDAIQNSKWSDLGVGGKASKAFFYLPVKMLRALIATDALAHYTAREFFATTKAYNKVLRTGMSKKDSSFWESVESELHNNKADQNLAMKQALSEKQKIIDGGGSLNNFDVKRRSREILEEMRSDDIQQFSEDKADKSRLGQTPTGILGYMYEKATDASANITGLNRIIPFLRIPTNAMDMWLDYTPWGYKRAAIGKSSILLVRSADATKERLKVGRSNMTPDERVDHLIKASLGTLTLSMIAGAVLSNMDLDDDDPSKWFDISYKGFGSFRENEGLRNSGWREMSFRFKNPFTGEFTEWFDYRDSPMAMIFSSIGSMHDEKKYKRAGEENVEASDLVSSGVINSLLFVSEQNYTKSLMNLSNVFSREGTVESNAKNFSGDYIKKNVQAVFYPSIYKQSYQTYKAVAQKKERFVTRYSDNWSKGIKENILKDVPYIEDKLGEDAFDQLGYPITRRIEDVPLIPEFVLDGMQTIISNRYDSNEKPAWELFNKHKFTIGWNGARTYEGRDLTTEEQIALKRKTANIIREELEDSKEFNYLYNLTRAEFIEEVQRIKSYASEEAKYQLFDKTKK